MAREELVPTDSGFLWTYRHPLCCPIRIVGAAFAPAGFWDLVDLYAGMRLSSVTVSVAEVLSKHEWIRNLVPGVATMPGSLGQRWER